MDTAEFKIVLKWFDRRIQQQEHRLTLPSQKRYKCVHEQTLEQLLHLRSEVLLQIMADPSARKAKL